MDNRILNHKFHRWLVNAENFERDWRKRNQRNFDFYDGDQWTADEKETLINRGQQPTVLNLIRPTIDMVLSLEVEKRSDLQVVGRNPDDVEIGDILTALLKQVRDQSSADFFESKSFRDGIIGGRGWLFVDLERKQDREIGKIVPGQVFVRHIPWEEVFIDPYHRLPDGTDARFIIRKVWVDRDILKQRYPKKADKIDGVFNEDYEGIEYRAQKDAPDRATYKYYDPLSGRVCTCHCWYKDARGRVRFVLFADEVFLEGDPEDDSANEPPNKVDCYPLIPFTAFRRRQGDPQGLVEHLIDYQVQINKLNSKYLWDISTNRLMIENDALDVAENSVEEARIEWARPNGVVITNPGGLSKIRVEENLRELQYLDSHLQLLMGLMQRTSGVNDSMTGIGGQNERSAMQQSNRILQGASMQTQILENLHFTKLQTNKVMLRLIAEHYKKGIMVRILMPNGTYEFKALNQDMVDPETQQIVDVLNRIDDVLQYDVILNRVPPFSSVRERACQMFTEAAKSGVFPPEIVGQVMMELLDIPNKKIITQKMEQLYGQQRQAQGAQQMADIASQLPQ